MLRRLSSRQQQLLFRASTLSTCRMRFSCSGMDGTMPGGMPTSEEIKYPIVALPSRSFFERQGSIDLNELRRGVSDDMLKQLKESRKYYQYPSLSAPSIGWNAQVFTLFDDSIFINPEIIGGNNKALTTVDEVRKFSGVADIATGEKPPQCWTWEPCASCPFLMHYIKRPSAVTIRAYNERGEQFSVTLDKMKGRLALHEMDHMFGILFTKRIPDVNHAVPLDSFSTVTEWSDDWPSLEARSTFLYTLYTPPVSFVPDAVTDADFMDRKFDKRIYPGMEMEGVLTPPSTDAERRYYSDLWRRTKEELDELSNTSPQSSSPSSSTPKKSKLKEMSDDVASEAETEASRDTSL